jgi:hypothetical protein
MNSTCLAYNGSQAQLLCSNLLHHAQHVTHTAGGLPFTGLDIATLVGVGMLLLIIGIAGHLWLHCRVA